VCARLARSSQKLALKCHWSRPPPWVDGEMKWCQLENRKWLLSSSFIIRGTNKQEVWIRRDKTANGKYMHDGWIFTLSHPFSIPFNLSPSLCHSCPFSVRKLITFRTRFYQSTNPPFSLLRVSFAGRFMHNLKKGFHLMMILPKEARNSGILLYVFLGWGLSLYSRNRFSKAEIELTHAPSSMGKCYLNYMPWKVCGR